MTRRRAVWGLILGVLFLLVVSSSALADTDYGRMIVGSMDLYSASSTYVYQQGDSYVPGIYDCPDYIYIRLEIFKGGLYIDYVDEPMYSFNYTADNKGWNSSLSGDWFGYGWHYALWEVPLEEDSCSTYETAGGRSPDPSWFEHIGEYASKHKLADWTAISYLESSQVLREVLGQQAGVSLDRTIHMDLADNLAKGDRVPALFLAPDGFEALAVYFHADGSLTETTLEFLLGNWEVCR